MENEQTKKNMSLTSAERSKSMTKDECKILSLDLETSPIQAYSWGPKYESNLIEFIEHMRILSFSAKWLNGKHITKGWPDYKGYKKGVLDDKEITKELWNLLDEADIVLAQNGKSYDVKVMNARFAFHNMAPTSPYKTLDTKLEARKYLRLPSYSLNDLCDYFGLGRKKEHEGFSLWLKCISGDKSAWKRMLAYNRHDVVLLEKLYLRLRPWMNHPNLGMYTDKLVCPNCGSGKIQSRGYAISSVTKYKRFQCTNCGKWGRDTKNINTNRLIVPTQ